MRRDEFNVTDTQTIKKILDECEFGTLSLISEGKPYGVAVNFVWYENKIYIHGAKEGRKVSAIQQNSNASFLVVKPYSLIPSYFSNTVAACPATQFFASVHCEGVIKEVIQGEEKAIILNKMMEKLQSDGGYEPIAFEKPMYAAMIEKTAIFELNIEYSSCKVKAGQNFSKEKKEDMMQKLKHRGSKIDTETIEAMGLVNKEDFS
jgi:nitroimidazol reductase NimA-like FMN-containing flavoprotein (pyridoxamine 5'-phosphate oxidase superfamily)